MALYLISYDIAEKDAFEYDALWAKLRDMGATKILYSEWVVPSNLGATQSLYEELRPLVQDKDRLLVQEIVKNAAWDRLLIGDDDFKALMRNART